MPPSLTSDDDRVAVADLTISVRLGARLGPGHRTVRLAGGATVADLLPR